MMPKDVNTSLSGTDKRYRQKYKDKENLNNTIS